MYFLKSPYVKICCGILLLGLLMATLDFRTVIVRLAQIHVADICISFAIVTIAVVVATAKLRVALSGFPFWPIFRATVLLQFYNLFPIGQVGGEVLRVVALTSSRQGAPRIAAAAIFDRITGMIAVLISLLIALAAEPDRFGRSLNVAVMVLGGGTIAGIVVVTRVNDRWLHCQLFGYRLPIWLLEFVERCTKALKAFIGRPGIVASSIALGLVHQALIIYSLAILGASLGVMVSIATWAIVIGVSSIVMLLPISVAGLGTRDLSFVALFGLAAVKPETALALSFAALGLQVLTGIASGLVLLTPARPTRSGSQRYDVASPRTNADR